MESAKLLVLDAGPALKDKYKAKQIDHVLKAIEFACARTVVLMRGGVDDCVDWVVDKIQRIKNKHGENMPIYPIVNEKVKSDAWLTGLTFTKLNNKKIDLNPKNIGFAIHGQTAGHTARALKQEVEGNSVLALIDDATYSGTQAEAMLVNAALCDLFLQRDIKAGYLIVAGASALAQKRLEENPLSKQTPIEVLAQTEIPSGPFGSSREQEAVRTLPTKPKESGVPKAEYRNHRELDPATLKLKPTTGEFQTFTDLSYAILPYKIPDSVSVPVHIYAACGYWNNDNGLTDKEEFPLITSMSHLFQSDGSIDYRTTLYNARNSFFTEITSRVD